MRPVGRLVGRGIGSAGTITLKRRTPATPRKQALRRASEYLCLGFEKRWAVSAIPQAWEPFVAPLRRARQPETGEGLLDGGVFHTVLEVQVSI